MALNLSTFKTRSLTAAAFVVVMLAGMLLSQWTFFLLFSVIHFGCWIEYQRLIRRIDPDYGDRSPIHKYGVMLAGWCFMLYFTNNSFGFFGMNLHELGWWMGLLLIIVLPVAELLLSGVLRPRNIGYSAIGLLYISLSWGLMMDIYCIGLNEPGEPGINGEMVRFTERSPVILPLVIIATIWINDTMAYIVGSLIGKTPFSTISPKKTWEGTAGGAILAIAVVSLSMIYILPETDLWFWLGLSAVASITGTIGDLLESKLKRMAEVKDSGNLLPGHGGFLDRFDSMLLAIPCVWVYLWIITD